MNGIMIVYFDFYYFFQSLVGKNVKFKVKFSLEIDLSMSCYKNTFLIILEQKQIPNKRPRTDSEQICSTMIAITHDAVSARGNSANHISSDTISITNLSRQPRTGKLSAYASFDSTHLLALLGRDWQQPEGTTWGTCMFSAMNIVVKFIAHFFPKKGGFALQQELPLVNPFGGLCLS